MDEEKRKKSKIGILFIVFLLLLAGASMIEWTPFHYKKIISAFKTLSGGETNISSSQATPTLTVKAEINSDIRKKLENGGGINFWYNYIPSERAWNTMYTYTIIRQGSSGDCTFSCSRYTLEKNDESLCRCYYSEDIWNRLLDLLLNREELVECTSVYDSNGMVVSTPIAKTFSIAGAVYSPKHIDEIESYFKMLAMNAGVSANDLNWNIPIDDAKVEDKSTIKDLHGSFLWNPVGSISDQEKQKIESYLRSKYEETGVRVYIILYNSDNLENLKNDAHKMIARATSPGIVFGITASQSWYIRYLIDNDRESALRDAREQLSEAYGIKGSLYDKIMNVIDRIYELY